MACQIIYHRSGCGRRGDIMKAMLLTAPNTPFELVDLPDPVAGPGEAVARVITCGSGLTIQHIKAGRRQAEFRASSVTRSRARLSTSDPAYPALRWATE